MQIADSVDTRTVPNSVSYFRLLSDGSYSDVASLDTGRICYIDESQVALLWQKDISDFIRERFGDIVGVMHTRHLNVLPPVYPTRKFILGG